MLKALKNLNYFKTQILNLQLAWNKVNFSYSLFKTAKLK